MMKKKKESLDIENLNKLIILGKKILKVVLVLTILASVVLGIVILSRLKVGSFVLSVLKVASPFFIGFILAWILNPLVTKLEKKNIKRGLGSTIVFIGFLLIMFLVIKIMVPMLYKQINEFVSTIPSLFNSLASFIEKLFVNLSSTGFDFSGIESKVYDSVETFGSEITTSLPSIIINSVSSIISSIGQVGLGLIIGFYLLVDFNRMGKIFDIVPKKYKNTHRH